MNVKVTMLDSLQQFLDKG